MAEDPVISRILNERNQSHPTRQRLFRQLAIETSVGAFYMPVSGEAR